MTIKSHPGSDETRPKGRAPAIAFLTAAALAAVVGCDGDTPESDADASSSTSDVGDVGDDAAGAGDAASDVGADAQPDTGGLDVADATPDASGDGSDTVADAIDDTTDPDAAAPDVVEWPPPDPYGLGCAEYAEPVARGSLPDGLTEISGLAMASTPGVLWMHNDSGAGPTLFAVDIDSGALLATVTLTVEFAWDWEDMAAGPCEFGDADRCLYVGDVGDNAEARTAIGVPSRIHRIVEPDPGAGDQTIDAVDTMILGYPEGADYNVESVVVDQYARVYVLTKQGGDAFQLFGALFRASDTAVAMSDYGTFDLSPMLPGSSTRATAADFDPVLGRLIVRGWTGMLEYVLPDGIDLPAMQDVRPAQVPFAAEPQGEAVVYGDGGYYQVSEGAGSTIYFVGCDVPATERPVLP